MLPVHPDRRAFSLIELLVVVTIISLLFSMIMPTIRTIREAASKVDCSNNLRQIGMAQGAYCQDNRGFLPFNAGGWGSGQTGQDKKQLEYMLAPYFSSRQDAGGADDWWSGISQCKTWVCRSSPIIGFAPWGAMGDPNPKGIQYQYRGGMVGQVNAYEGAFQYMHWYKRNASDPYPAAAYMKLVSFAQISAVPFHFCSNRWQASYPWTDGRPWYYACQGISWHPQGARPTVFLDGRVKVIVDPAYTIGANPTLPAAQSLLVAPWNYQNFAVVE